MTPHTSKTNERGRITTQRRFRLRQVHYVEAPDRVELVVQSQGRHTSLFVGTERGDCLGILEDQALIDLAEEILDRRHRPTPSFSSGL